MLKLFTYLRLFAFTHDPTRGCSGEEIAKMESAFDVRLPRLYRHFLMRFGRDAEASRELSGSDYYYPRLLELRAGAEELLRESSAAFLLHPQDFVFHMHQGYQFFFFRADGECQDPPVFHYLEAEAKPQQKYRHLSDWFRAFL